MPSSPRTAENKPSCEGCFFGRQKLCALELDAPCATFRPDGPDGLKPQRQLRFAFRMADGESDFGVPRAPSRRQPRRAPGMPRHEQPMLAPTMFA
jgi:hypothetical protein